jgi:N-acetyl-anhydromuramyl-L-alanine amidase AmpD
MHTFHRAAIVLILALCLLPALQARAADGYDPKAIVRDVFTPERLKLTAEYDRIHYGLNSSDLKDPQMIVLHYTAFHTLQESLRFFEPSRLDTVSRADIKSGGAVNVSAHYLVDRDGTVYQLASENVVCRHIIGFNYTAIGIENVGSGADDLTVKQAESDAALIRRIKERHPGIGYLIGHQEYQDASLPHFKLYREKENSYRFTPKHDPGSWFLNCVRGLLKDRYGLVFED